MSAVLERNSNDADRSGAGRRGVLSSSFFTNPPFVQRHRRARRGLRPVRRTPPVTGVIGLCGLLVARRRRLASLAVLEIGYGVLQDCVMTNPGELRVYVFVVVGIY